MRAPHDGNSMVGKGVLQVVMTVCMKPQIPCSPGLMGVLALTLALHLCRV